MTAETLHILINIGIIIITCGVGVLIGLALAVRIVHGKDGVLRGKEAEEFFRRMEENNKRGGRMLCATAGPGYQCKRDRGHDGPCAAVPLFGITARDWDDWNMPDKDK